MRPIESDGARFPNAGTPSAPPVWRAMLSAPDAVIAGTVMQILAGISASAGSMRTTASWRRAARAARSPRRPRTDSTHVLGAVRSLNRTGVA